MRLTQARRPPLTPAQSALQCQLLESTLQSPLLESALQCPLLQSAFQCPLRRLPDPPWRPPDHPDPEHPDHPHLQPAIKPPIKSCSTQSQIVRSTVHYPEPYQSLSFVYPVCTYPQMLQRSSDPDLLDSSTIQNFPAKDTASAFSDKNPRTAQSVSTHLLTVTSVSLCNSFNKPTGVCINPLSPACVL